MRSKSLCSLIVLVSLALGAAVVAGGSIGGGADPAAAAGANAWDGPLVPDSGVLFGAWIRRDYSSQATIQDAIESREASLGRKLAIDHHFYPFAKTFPSWREPWDIKNGRTPLIAWNGTNTWEVVRGDHDALIRERARAVKALGAPVFLRYMWEPSAKLSLIGSPAEYRDAWRRIRLIFEQEGATNVTWAWCGTAWGMRPGGPEFQYYPGDDVADWVCTDGYNWAPGRAGDQWRDWSWIMQGTHDFAVAHNKPVMIAEFGVQERNAGEKAAWMRDAQAVIKTSFPNIKAIVYFDENRLYDWRVDTTTSSYAAYKDWMNDPFYKATPGGGAPPPTTTTTTTAPPPPPTTTTTTTAPPPPPTTTTTAPPPTTTTTAAPPTSTSLLSESFESGTLSGWDHSKAAFVTKARASSGIWSLQTAATAGRAWARHGFPATAAVSARAAVFVDSPAPNSTVPLVGLRDARGKTIVRVIRSTDGRLGIFDGSTDTRRFGSTVIASGSWHDVRLVVRVAGPNSSVRVLLDGVEVPDLPLTGLNLGTAPAAALELADLGGQLIPKTYSLYFDDVAVTAS